MTRIFTTIATASMLSVLSFAGIAHADGMKTDMTKMHNDTMKTQTMKKATCPWHPKRTACTRLTWK